MNELVRVRAGAVDDTIFAVEEFCKLHGEAVAIDAKLTLLPQSSGGTMTGVARSGMFLKEI